MRIVLALAMAATATGLTAQSPDTPRFEVTSVRQNTLDDGVSFDEIKGNRFALRGYSLGRMIRTAYQVQEFQVVGGPEWVDVDRFDVQATFPEGTPPGQANVMLRALLADRFKLAVHTETRERPVFALVTARGDGRAGPGLRASTIDCAAKGAQPCSMSMGPGFIRIRGRTMADFTTLLSRLSLTGSSLNRLIINRTGLEGRYDAELKFTPDVVPPPGLPLPAGFPAIDPNGPSIFTALQEQLGLKLDAQRAPVDVLVIDRAERPTEN